MGKSQFPLGLVRVPRKVSSSALGESLETVAVLNSRRVTCPTDTIFSVLRLPSALPGASRRGGCGFLGLLGPRVCLAAPDLGSFPLSGCVSGERAPEAFSQKALRPLVRPTAQGHFRETPSNLATCLPRHYAATAVTSFKRKNSHLLKTSRALHHLRHGSNS